MVTSIWDDLKREFSSGNMITRLIIINVAVFVVVNLVKVGFAIVYPGVSPLANGFQDFLHLFCMSSDGWYLLTHPWIPLTSMFLHEGFWHVVWNMLFLYWFGKIVGGFIGDHHVLPLYLLSGFAGGFAFYLSDILIYGDLSFALGASGAVNGIILASAIIAPDYIMRLLFIGDVKLKYVVSVLLFLNLISIANVSNTGGAFAHLGGALFGWFYIYQLRSGSFDISSPVNNIVNAFQAFFQNILGFFTGKKNKLRVEYKNPKSKPAVKSRSSMGRFGRSRGNAKSDKNNLPHQERVDAILEKIKKSGYESLTAEEKEFLFNASKK
jgi:membrane associated rhomboid family serine protease